MPKSPPDARLPPGCCSPVQHSAGRQSPRFASLEAFAHPTHLRNGQRQSSRDSHIRHTLAGHQDDARPGARRTPRHRCLKSALPRRPDQEWLGPSYATLQEANLMIVASISRA